MNVTIMPSRTIYGCATKRAEEGRGLMGFHAYAQCPACRIELNGLEAWNDAGFRCSEYQGQDPEEAIAWAARIAPRYHRVLLGWPIDFQGPWSDAVGPAYGIPEAGPAGDRRAVRDALVKLAHEWVDSREPGPYQDAVLAGIQDAVEALRDDH